jgi:DNA-binding CsgD family transcriptional regulator
LAGEAANRDMFAEARSGGLTASELISRYCTLVYSQTGSYEETARRLQLDRRTVKAKVNSELLAALRTTKRVAAKRQA